MTVRSSHLVRLKGICQLADQRASLVRSFCNVWWSFGVVMLLKIKTSSAYSLYIRYIELVWRSRPFLKIKGSGLPSISHSCNTVYHESFTEEKFRG